MIFSFLFLWYECGKFFYLSLRKWKDFDPGFPYVASSPPSDRASLSRLLKALSLLRNFSRLSLKNLFLGYGNWCFLSFFSSFAHVCSVPSYCFYNRLLGTLYLPMNFSFAIGRRSFLSYCRSWSVLKALIWLTYIYIFPFFSVFLCRLLTAKYLLMILSPFAYGWSWEFCVFVTWGREILGLAFIDPWFCSWEVLLCCHFKHCILRWCSIFTGDFLLFCHGSCSWGGWEVGDGYLGSWFLFILSSQPSESVVLSSPLPPL